MSPEEIKGLVKDVPDFPKPGIVFKDITPLLSNAAAFAAITELLGTRAKAHDADAILAIESRGFIFGAALAYRLKLPMHLVRKRGKLPRETVSVEYDLEYGTDRIELHADAVEKGRRYLVVDDVIATGGTAAAVAQLVTDQGGKLAACLFVLELKYLNGRHRLDGHNVECLMGF
ncbi:MAG TPA: adenine phosphoribosyltransferase [Gammaproteobacteria bacterium]|nr:adenine phosphoribosyltransferase [Gammaproteobacteria bacterium]